jgi:hypothetical protein
MRFFLIPILTIVILCGCIGNNTRRVNRDSGAGNLKQDYSSTTIILYNDTLTLSGKGLKKVTFIKILRADNKRYDLVIVNQNDKTIVAKLKENMAMVAGEAFGVIIGNAYGETVIGAVFSVANGSITNIKLAPGAVTSDKISGPLGGAGVSSGEVLKWNGIKWIPSNLDSLSYKGSWDARHNIPDLNSIGFPEIGSFYLTSIKGNFNLNGIYTWNAGDWVIFGENGWERIQSGSQVSSVFGRKGVVIATDNDYTWAQINKESSSIGDIRDVDCIGPRKNESLGHLKVRGQINIENTDRLIWSTSSIT